MKDSGRDEIHPFIWKVQRQIGKSIKLNNYDRVHTTKKLNELKQKIMKDSDIQKPDIYHIPNENNSNNLFLRFDIISANYNMIRLINSDYPQTFEDYFKKIIPIDKRTNGTFTNIPDCIYKSKFLRVVTLSKINVKSLYNLYTCELTEKLIKIMEKLEIKPTIYLGLDEVCIKLENMSQALDIIGEIKFDESIFRYEMLHLEIINEKSLVEKIIYPKEKKRLLNVDPIEYAELYKKYIV
jgi:hypothetical protein